MKQHVLAALLLFTLTSAAFLLGCSSSSSGAGSSPGTSGPQILAADIGQSCNGGTSSGDTVALKDSSCKQGFCLADDSGGSLDSLQVYCTADCSNAQCPSGYSCKKTTLESTYDCFKNGDADSGT